jgi:hypothetical protein
LGTGQKFGSIDTLVHQTHSSQETLVDEDANSSGVGVFFTDLGFGPHCFLHMST